MAGEHKEEAASSPLTLSLFGPFTARLHGGPLPCPLPRKEQWLLALLVLRAREELERLWLAGTLWPDSSPDQALHNLRNSLSHLRQALGPEGDRLRSPSFRTLALDLSGTSVDVVAFDQAISRADPTSLEAAVALYRGPLLEGCGEEWVLQERRVREEAYLRALESLARQAWERGELGTAERHLRRAVGVDPLRESAQRALMQSLAGEGNYAAALEVYRELRLRLHQELNVAPDPETVALFEQLRAEARSKAALGARHSALGGRRTGGVPYDGGPVPSSAECRAPSTGVPARSVGGGSAATLTFLFTDIEGSVELWERHPEAMGRALTRHDDLLRHAIESRGGIVFKTVGDAVCAVFPTAPEAVAAALAAQQALRSEPWGDVGALRVRMALHTGSAETRGDDYFGPTVNRAARLLDAAHGGQILLSQATQELARDHLPEGVALHDLGEHRLKDLDRPERLFQATAPDLPGDFPPPRTLDARHHNLPIRREPLLGREEERAALRDLLLRDDTALVTLTGPGGTGKTRLALQLAAELLDDFEHGACFVDLSPLRDPDLVLPTLAAALGLREGDGRSAAEFARDYLREKRLLLLLDNFEQVLPAAPEVAELLATAPGVKILATSRERLRLRGEREFPVPPLPVPDLRRLEGETEPAAALSHYAAVELFSRRATSVQPGFAVTNESAPAVAEICYRLDGLPLAIELAAARVKLLSPPALLSRLGGGASGSSLQVLTGGARDLPARQQTLRETIRWSYDLLSETEQQLFRRLSVFAGGFTLEAAEAVCGEAGSVAGGRWSVNGDDLPQPTTDLQPPTPPFDLLDVLASLVEKSLVRQDETADGEPRFGMLETIREFARECLASDGTERKIREGHAAFFVKFAERAELYLTTGEGRRWLMRVEAELDNIRAVLAASQQRLDTTRAEAGLRLLAALEAFWVRRGHWTEARGWLVRFLTFPDRTPSYARALRTAGILAWLQGDFSSARAYLEESVALERKQGRSRELAYALTHLGMLFNYEGKHDAAFPAMQEAVDLIRPTGDTWGLALSLQHLAQEVCHHEGIQAGCVVFQEGLRLFREAGDEWGIALALLHLGSRYQNLGAVETARGLLEESLKILRGLGDRWLISDCVGALGDAAQRRGDLQQAAALYRERLVLLHELGNLRRLSARLRSHAEIATVQGDLHRAARLLGAASALRDTLDASRSPVDRAEEKHRAADACRALGEEAFAAAWAEGQAMSLGDAVADALSEKEEP